MGHVEARAKHKLGTILINKWSDSKQDKLNR